MREVDVQWEGVKRHKSSFHVTDDATPEQISAAAHLVAGAISANVSEAVIDRSVHWKSSDGQFGGGI